MINKISQKMAAAKIFILTIIPVLVFALEPMTEGELSTVQGRDGVTVSLNATGISAQQLSLQIDTPTPSQSEGLYLNNLQLTKTGTEDIWFTTDIDVGSDVNGPLLSINSHADTSRFSFSSMTLNDSTRSFGEWALVGGMDFRLINRGLFFTDDINKPASLYFALTDAKWFYRQNWYYHANLTFDNLDFFWDMPEASVGVTNDGLRLYGAV